MSNFLIQEITSGDFEPLSHLYKTVFDQAWPLEDVKRRFEQSSVHGLMAKDGEQLAGFVVWQNAVDSADIWYIGVAEKARGKKLATELWHAMRTTLMAQNIEKLFIEVRNSNAAAIGFYEHVGAQHVSVRKGYYRNSNGTREDALVMCFDMCK